LNTVEEAKAFSGYDYNTAYRRFATADKISSRSPLRMVWVALGSCRPQSMDFKGVITPRWCFYGVLSRKS
jgi:hypothetical protein